MYKPMINKQIIKNHFQYDFRKYVTIVLVFAFSWNLLVTILTPGTPEELKFNVYFIGQYMTEEESDAIQQQISGILQGMEEVNVFPISYESGGEMEMYTIQKIVTMIAGREGDVYVFDPDMFKAYGESGLFYALDEQMTFFKPLYTEDQLALGYFPETEREYDAEGNLIEETILSEPHQYGIPVSGFVNLDVSTYPIGQQLVGITAYSTNFDEAIELFKVLTGAGK
jgi:hypothetical protein